MITRDPYRISYPPTKPGYGEPEPLEPVRTCDPPEIMAVCLSCPIGSDCDTTTKACPLYGQSAAAKRKRRRRQ